MSLTLQQSGRQVLDDIQQKADKLASKKEDIAMAGLERLQKSNEIAALLSQKQNRIDVYV